jgi:hypothetical protein
MTEIIDFDKKQKEEMLRRYNASGQQAFNEALATPDVEASQDAFDRFVNGTSTEVAHLPAAPRVGHTAVSGAEQPAQVLQFPKQ